MSDTPKESTKNDLWELAKFIISPPLYAILRINKWLQAKAPKPEPKKPPKEE